MRYSSQHLESLVEELGRLPGIGKKTAQRLAFHLLRVDQQEALDLAHAIERVRLEVGTCDRCGNVAETQPCYLCADSTRDPRVLCVVEQPGDVVAIERSGAFRGLYHVLRGTLSPLDGIGPESIGLQELIDRVQREGATEVILATNPTNQGEATSHLIADLLRGLGIEVTRIARGIPMGSEIELSDQATLVRALEGRKPIGS
jgi:recombination protein RecR